MTNFEQADRGEDIQRREAIMAHLAEQLREQVGVDPVTGLDARGRFEERVVQEVKRGARQGHVVAVAVVEVAHHGNFGAHLSATVLEQVADELRAELRDIDSIGRVGGARFAALLPTCDAGCASVAVDRVVKRLSRLTSIDLYAGLASTAQVSGWDLLEAAEADLDAARAAVEQPDPVRLAG